MNKTKKLAGFTLLETLIVMSLVGCLVILTISPLKRSYSSLEEKIFWRKMERTWVSQYQNVKQKKQALKIIYYPTKVVFKSDQRVILKYPTTLAVFKIQKIQVNSRGHVKPATVIFKSKVNNCYYYVKFQLGYGGCYRIEQKME